MQSALVTNRQFVIKYKIIYLFTYLNNNKVWNKIMGNLLKALASRCDLKSIEILSKKREINEFSTRCNEICSLSFLHNSAFLVCDVIRIRIPPCTSCYASNKSELRWSKREMALIKIFQSLSNLSAKKIYFRL